MKKIGVEDVLQALEEMGPTIDLDQEIIERNRPPLERMLSLE